MTVRLLRVSQCDLTVTVRLLRVALGSGCEVIAGSIGVRVRVMVTGLWSRGYCGYLGHVDDGSH